MLLFIFFLQRINKTGSDKKNLINIKKRRDDGRYLATFEPEWVEKRVFAKD